MVPGTAIGVLVGDLLFFWLAFRLAEKTGNRTCLLYTSDAADERSSVDLGGRRIIKKKTQTKAGAWAGLVVKKDNDGTTIVESKKNTRGGRGG